MGETCAPGSSAWGRRAGALLLVAGTWLGAPDPARADPPPEDEGEASEHDLPAPPVPEPPPVTPRPSAVVVKDGMALVPGGRFTMGSRDRKAPPNERPPRPATVRPFWLDRTEVTVGAYRACVDEGRCTPPGRTSATCTWDLGDPQLPVSCVRFEQAERFCRARGKRLPPEVEWELAARGTEGRRFPWGDGPGGCRAAATPLHDATGRTCRAAVPSAPTRGRQSRHPRGERGDGSGSTRSRSPSRPLGGGRAVLRAGGWLAPSDARATSAAGRAASSGAQRGLRCARDAPRGPPRTRVDGRSAKSYPAHNGPARDLAGIARSEPKTPALP